MQTTAVKAMVGEPPVYFGQVEAEGATPFLARSRHLGAKRGEHLGWRPRHGG